MFRIFLLLIAIIAVSCGDDKIGKIEYDPSLVFNEKEITEIKVPYGDDSLKYCCYCTLENDTLYIHYDHPSFWGWRSLTFKSYSGKFTSSYRVGSDVGMDKILYPTKQQLLLKKKEYHVGSYLQGYLFFEGECEDKNSFSGKSSAKLEGNFACTIKESSYSTKDFIVDLDMEYLNERALSGQDTSSYLWLVYDRLKVIPSEVERFPRLLTLDVSGNHLKKLDLTEYEIFEQLKLLRVSENQIDSLYDNIPEGYLLEELDLSRNSLKSLPPSFCNLKELDSLDLSGNDLKALPPSLFQLNQLQTLSLGDNQLKEIPGDIGHLKNLRELILYGNKELNNLPNEIYTLDSLEDLYLPDHLEKLSKDISRLKNLVFLSLPFDLLESNATLLSKMENLQTIDCFINGASEEEEKAYNARLTKIEEKLPYVEIHVYFEGY